MRLDIASYSVLFAGGLGLAYWASLPAAESDPNKVSVIAVDPKNVVELTLSGGEAAVTAVRRQGDSKFWITYSKPAVAKPDGTPGDPATAVNERFLAGEKIKDILDGLNPLEAQRAIGKLDEKQAEEFGLKDSKEKFTVKASNGTTLALIVGKQSYGSRNRFVRDEKDGRVLLINGDIISDLAKANIRLYERGLLSTPMEEASKAEVKAGPKSKKFDHTKKDQTGNRFWSEDAEEHFRSQNVVNLIADLDDKSSPNHLTAVRPRRESRRESFVVSRETRRQSFIDSHAARPQESSGRKFSIY